MKNDKKAAKPKLTLTTDTVKNLSARTGVQAGAVKGTMANCTTSYRVCTI